MSVKILVLLSFFCNIVSLKLQLLKEAEMVSAIQLQL